VIACGIFGAGFFFGFERGFKYGREQQEYLDKRHRDNAAPVSDPEPKRFRMA
jgi:hypothetical protein